MADTLYLIDAHSLIFQVFHAIPALTGPKGQPINAVFGFTGDLLRLRKKNPTYLICAFDPPGKTFRDGLFQEYKATRAPMPDDLAAQIPVILRIVEAMCIPIVQVPGYEADDAIATLADRGDRAGMEVFVCTGDKDCRQLISDRVKLYNLRKDTLLDRAGLAADWGIAPEQVVDLLALVGDSVDNVPGVPGVGIKTAQKLLQAYGTIAGILEHLDEIKGAKVRENLRAHADRLALSRELVRLRRDVPIPGDWDDWRLRPMDEPALLALVDECGMHRYASELRSAARLRNGAASARSAASDSAPQRQAELFSTPAAEAPAWPGTCEVIDTPAKLTAFLKQLKRQTRFALDLETTDVEPMRAEIVGYAFCWEPLRAYYLPVRGPKGQKKLAPAATLKKLKPILEDPRIEKINQNIKFDMIVLRAAGVELAGVAGDPMLASYLLESGERSHNLETLAARYLGAVVTPITDLIGKGKSQRRMDEVEIARVARYAGEDADVAWRLCAQLEPQVAAAGLDALYRHLELPLVEVLAELEYNGVKVDVPVLRRLSEEFADQLHTLEQEIYALAGHPFNIGSPKQLRQILFHELRLPPSQRKTLVTGEASTRQEDLEDLAAAGHVLPRKIIEYRQIAKLKGTYVDALPELVNPRTGRVHASFNQAATATGRLSSSAPNLQNIPIRTEQGRQIRQAFVPGTPGWVLLTADYSQIELRVLAHYAKDAELQRAFQEDRDIHAHVAAQIYGVAEDEVTSAQRRTAKTVNFGVIYGLSAFGLGKRLGISTEEATAFIDAYFARYPGVAAFQQKLLDDARRDRYVTTILGRRRAIEGIRPESSYRQRNQAEREALNTVIQGSAADLIKQAMLNIHRRLRREGRAARMLLQIHDELVFEVPPDERDAVAALVAEEMTGALALDVPLKVDLAAGPNWLEVEPLDAAVLNP
jgi:DNA polymerase-1